jgi:hypothetical protein
LWRMIQSAACWSEQTDWVVGGGEVDLGEEGVMEGAVAVVSCAA